MIQLNLLPDIKMQYIKTKRSKRMVMIFSVLSVSVSVGLLIIMFSLTALQKNHIKELDKDIGSVGNSLRDTKDLAKILTVQNQLNSLPALYAQRPVSSRIFAYMQQTTPVGVGVSHLTLDFTQGTLTIEGISTTLETVNRYADTLKFTKYKAIEVESNESLEEKNAFSEVVLSDFGRDTKEATFSITLKFDPIIFDAAYTVTLVVPETISTRSETELPGSGLFNVAPVGAQE